MYKYTHLSHLLHQFTHNFSPFYTHQKLFGTMKMMFTVAVFTTVMTVAMGGEVYMVGDSDGWTSIGHVNYKAWASAKSFKVGDTIVFRYNKIFHDVARVTYTDFKTCNASNPYTTFTSGNDSFPIKHPGHYFFICTQPGHCELGQKVDIRVPFTRQRPAHGPGPVQPLPFPYPQPFRPSPSPVHSPAATPSPAVPVRAPEIAPSVPKNGSCQLGVGFRVKVMVMVFFVYLMGGGI